MRPERRAWLDGAARRLVAFVGTVPGAVLVGVGLARRLLLELEARFALGFGLVFGLWVAALCLVWLSRSGGRAVAWCAAFSGVGAALAGVGP